MREISLGEGDRLEPVTALAGPGYTFRATRKHVRDRIVYRHSLDTFLLHVTMSGGLRRMTGRFGTGPAVSMRGRSGMVHFTPPGWDRYGALEDGEVTAVEIELDRALVEDSNEQRIASGSGVGFFNRADAKAAALADALIGIGVGEGRGLAADVLMTALARHVGLQMAGVPRRRDDAWLHPSALCRIVDRIDADPSTPPDLSELAGLAGLGPSALIRAFRGATGRTPVSFVMERRLAAARRALLADDAPLEAVAVDHGFSSKAHFITAFRGRYDLPPGRFRIENRAIVSRTF